MPCETDLYFPKADIVAESRLIPHVTMVSIPSLWGHAAGAGWNEQDAAFLNREIGKFMRGCGDVDPTGRMGGPDVGPSGFGWESVAECGSSQRSNGEVDAD